MDVERIALLTLDEAVQGFRAGSLTVVEYEAYRHVWALCSPVGADSVHATGWLGAPLDSAVAGLAVELVEVVRTRQIRDAARRGWGFVTLADGSGRVESVQS